MATEPPKSLKWSVLFVVATTLIVGCGKKDDAISQAEKKDVAKGVVAPSIEQTKAIAEEGFIYGLPLVMNYAVIRVSQRRPTVSAAAAKGGLYGNDAWRRCIRTPGSTQWEKCSMAPSTTTPHVPPGQLPPVNAFWSVTMYDGKSQFLIKNPINRYLINSPMLTGMHKNPDGSLTLYIQKDSPGKAKEANWLPAPNDTIYMAFRLYWPKGTPPSILPPGEGTWKPPGVVVSK